MSVVDSALSKAYILARGWLFLSSSLARPAAAPGLQDLDIWKRGVVSEPESLAEEAGDGGAA